jgi:hypothetical protein
MADFSYICKNLAGSDPGKGNEAGIPTCSKKLKTGTYCSADSAGRAAEAKTECPAVDFLKILTVRKKKW